MNPLENIMSTEEAARLWGISSQRVKDLCRDGKINAVKLGKTWILDRNQSNPRDENHWRRKEQ